MPVTAFPANEINMLIIACSITPSNGAWLINRFLKKGIMYRSWLIL
jgi:hypothetical protein